jgi:hypothetical protein
LEAPAHHQCDRVAVRHRALARARDQGRWFKNKGLLMAFKLLDMAQLRWRRLDWRSSVAAG